MPPETAMTAAAASYAVRSTQLDSAYPPPSCSAFQGRNGSRLCAVSTCGTPCSRLARCPARLAYHVCECTRSRAGSVVGRADARDDLQVHAERLQRGVAPDELGRDVVAAHPGLVARALEAVHPDVDAAAQHGRKLGHVHPRAPVDVRRVLPGEHVDTH